MVVKTERETLRLCSEVNSFTVVLYVGRITWKKLQTVFGKIFCIGGQWTQNNWLTLIIIVILTFVRRTLSASELNLRRQNGMIHVVFLMLLLPVLIRH